jgi:hypothetical protein
MGTGWANDSHWDDPEAVFWNPARSERKMPIKCKYCGVTGLHWVRVQERWKLHDKRDNPHFCILSMTI